jgi:acetyl esterase
MAILRKTLMRWGAQAMLRRPAGALVRQSGGTARVVAGRTLDPAFQFLEHRARTQPSPALPNPQARLALARSQTRLLATLFGGRLEPGVAARALHITGGAGPLPARLYTPHQQDASLPLLVFFHFGGGVVGDLDTCHAFCSMLARYGRTAVLSVDYRLAPEHPFPAGLEDALAAFAWGEAHASALGCAARPPAIGGDSMGGSFAAVVCQELKRMGKPQPALQLLIYPAVDLTAQDSSSRDFADAFPLTRETIDWFMENYLPAGADLHDLRLSPGLALDVAGLAPALVFAAGFDVLADSVEAYAAKLRAAGISAPHVRFDSLAHGFTAFTGAIPAADAAARTMAKATAAALRGA